MQRGKFLKLKCQTFWKPTEIEEENYREQMQNQEN